MRSFSFIPLIATLAFSAFTAAAPASATAALATTESTVGAQVPDLQRRCDGCDFIDGVIHSIQVEVDVVATLTSEVTVDVLTLHLNNVLCIINKAIDDIKADVHCLAGLAVADVVALLCTLLNLVCGLVNTVLGLLVYLDVTAIAAVKALLATLLCALGDLLCIILNVVGALLGDVVGTVTAILAGIGSLSAVSSVICLFDGVTAHFPVCLGGLLSVQGIISLVGGLLGGLLGLLGL